jgi:hypothetical protein
MTYHIQTRGRKAMSAQVQNCRHMDAKGQRRETGVSGAQDVPTQKEASKPMRLASVVTD